MAEIAVEEPLPELDLKSKNAIAKSRVPVSVSIPYTEYTKQLKASDTIGKTIRKSRRQRPSAPEPGPNTIPTPPVSAIMEKPREPYVKMNLQEKEDAKMTEHAPTLVPDKKPLSNAQLAQRKYAAQGRARKKLEMEQLKLMGEWSAKKKREAGQNIEYDPGLITNNALPSERNPYEAAPSVPSFQEYHNANGINNNSMLQNKRQPDVVIHFSEKQHRPFNVNQQPGYLYLA